MKQALLVITSAPPGGQIFLGEKFKPVVLYKRKTILDTFIELIAATSL